MNRSSCSRWKRSTSASISSSVVPRSSRRCTANASIAIAADTVRVSITRTAAKSAAAADALAERAGERRRELEREHALEPRELLVDRREVAGRGLRGGRQLRRRREPLVELRRAEVDVVAEALLAEADVQRHDAPVRVARRALGIVGGRVEDDRRVGGGQLHSLGERSAAVWIASTIRSSSSSLPTQVHRAGRVELLHLGARDGRGQAHDARRRRDPQHGLGRLGAGEPGHAVVDDNHVGMELRADLDRFLPRADRADDLEVAPEAEQQLQRLAEDLVVLDEDDLHGPRHGPSLRLYSAEISSA